MSKHESNIAAANATDSVHLQLHNMHIAPSIDKNPRKNDNQENDQTPSHLSCRTKIRVHAYIDPPTQNEWIALGITKRKFRAFLSYSLPEFQKVAKIQTTMLSLADSPDSPDISSDGANKDSKQTILSWEESVEIRKKFQTLWKDRRLVTANTSWVKERLQQSETRKDGSVTKIGSFKDRLNFQIERFEDILKDEKDQGTEQSLVQWLESKYGTAKTLAITAEKFRPLSPTKQMETLQHFLDWFRSVFPYYYDRCSHCGASKKDDVQNCQQDNDTKKKKKSPDAEDGDDEDDDDGTYLGQIYPTKDELQLGRASRIEVYLCHKCSLVYTFPRFNAAWSIIRTKQGRCGEYSILLYRMFRSLGHGDTLRYIVDWADHVWVELQRKRIEGDDESVTDGMATNPNWIHLDPCEAAVDKPLLYQSWGKKATYLIALHAPSNYSTDSSSMQSPLIEDVTKCYTSDSVDIVADRRKADGESDDSIRVAINRGTGSLRSKLDSLRGK